jgi:RNA polymerase subunit RPABC4/transcription elongation factor Spt4
MPQTEVIGTALLAIVAFISAFTAAFWVSLVIWTFRDMRARSRDIFAQLLASLVVLIFGPLGLLIYLILRPQETLSDAYARTLEEEALLQDISAEQPVCPECKHRIEPDFILCPACHAELRKACPHCGRLSLIRWDVCPYCGEPHPPRPELVPLPEPDLEPQSVYAKSEVEESVETERFSDPEPSPIMVAAKEPHVEVELREELEPEVHSGTEPNWLNRAEPDGDQ